MTALLRKVKRSLWIVMASEGNYEVREWVVAAFGRKDAADKWALGANAYVTLHGERHRRFCEKYGVEAFGEKWEKRPRAANPYDGDGMQCGDRPTYFVISVPLNPAPRSTRKKASR